MVFSVASFKFYSRKFKFPLNFLDSTVLALGGSLSTNFGSSLTTKSYIETPKGSIEPGSQPELERA